MSVTAGQATSGTGTTVTAPTGLANGDLIIVIQSNTTTGGAPAGWTRLFNDTSTVAINFAAWWKIASSEPASWTFTGGGTPGWACGYWTGNDTSSPINVSASPTNTNSSPTVTTTVAGCAIVQLAAIDELAGGYTFTIDANCTSFVQETTGPELAISHDTANQASAGLTTARSITNSSPRNTLIATVAIAPGAAPVAGTGTGTFTFTGTGTGTPKIAGTGAASFTFAGAGTGTALPPLAATGHGSFTFTGSGSGTVPQPPPLPTATGYPAGSAPKPFTYCLYDLLSGQFLGTLPFSQVTFGSQLLQPGTFSGTLDVASEAVQNLGVFDLLQTSQTALLIDYLGSFIWGGILWTAPFDQDNTKRQVQVGATEIWSYFANQRVQATDYSAPPYSGITGNSSYMPIWDASGTSVPEGGPGVYDPVLIAWQMLFDATYYVPSANLFGGTGIAANGYTTPADYLASGTNTPEADYLSESYPYSSLQQLGSALNQLATLGLGVGFDYGIDVGGSATGPVTCTINLSYPRRGRTFANNNLVLDCQRALKFSIPPDGTQTANTVYEQGANGALSVSQNAQPLAGGAPILERIMSRSNIQSANVMGVLQQTGAADLAVFSYPPYTPTVTTDLFTGPLQLGQFIVGDDVWWRIPKTDGVGNTYCPRFKQGLDVEGRIIGYQATVADAGTSQLTVTLSEPPSFTVEGPWLPTS